MLNREVITYIGLGSNLDDPSAQIERALEELQQLAHSRLVQTSPFYRSEPMGPIAQPDYINAVACLQTRLSPIDLLRQLQDIEYHHHRERTTHWGPRTLDLDMLLYGDITINSQQLIIPHPFMHERNFVLYPLADITPELEFPDGTKLQVLLDQCPASKIALL